MTDATAVARAVDRIKKRAADPRLVLVPGLADDLLLIGEALACLSTSVRQIQRDNLRRAIAVNLALSAEQG